VTISEECARLLHKLAGHGGKRPTTLAGELLEDAIVQRAQESDSAVVEKRSASSKASDDTGTRELVQRALKELAHLRKAHRNAVMQILWLLWGTGRAISAPVTRREINEWTANWLDGK
jgi:hypothetical protein